MMAADSSNQQSEAVQLKDGSTVDITRVPGVDDNTWNDVKNYLKENPETAKSLKQFAKNPEAMRGWLQTQAIADHYAKKMESDPQGQLQAKLKGLEDDPELKPVFEAIKQGGLEAVMKYFQDEELMIKISQKMGGLPVELQATMKQIDEKPLSFHEACKMGDLKAVQEYLDKNAELNSQDQKGITPLGYAIGSNRIAVVKCLLDKKANPFAVDAQGNSGLHYAAGYGRNELLEYLMKLGCHPDQPNAQGQTPKSVATTNQQQVALDLLNKPRGQ